MMKRNRAVSRLAVAGIGLLAAYGLIEALRDGVAHDVAERKDQVPEESRLGEGRAGSETNQRDAAEREGTLTLAEMGLIKAQHKAAMLPAASVVATDEEPKPGRHYAVRTSGGRQVMLELALDELWVSPVAGEAGVRRVVQAADLDGLTSQAEAVRRGEGAQVKLVLYPRGAKRGEWNRRLLSGSWMIELAEPVQPQTLERLADLGAVNPARPDYGVGFWVAEIEGDPGAALRSLEEARVLPGVRSVEPLLAVARQKKGIPNDPLFAQQWHLRNTKQGGGTAGADANATPAWDHYQGSGVVIGVIDDGVELTHPDLASNAAPDWHFDWNGNDSNPAPSQANGDFHGTAVAGAAAARGGNSLGVSGAAPLAQIAGLRLIAEPADDAEEAAAFAHQNQNILIKNISWGPPDTGDSLGEMGPLAKAAFANAVASGRGGNGTLMFWAGGNGRRYQDQSNKDGYANSIQVIAVGATTNKDAQASYSENGSNLVVSAPSSGGSVDIVTTDLQGNNGYNRAGVAGELGNRDYTRTFGGTSSATPLVSGVAALMLEANPNLGWRDVKEILLRSSRKIQPGSAGWTSRYGGGPDLPPIKHHESFGGGVVDAAKAVELAEGWSNLAAAQTLQATVSPNAPIPDAGAAVERSFDFSAETSLRVEHVEVTVNIPHAYRGDLEIQLVSPTGVISALAAVAGYDNGWDPVTDKLGAGYEPWTFSSVRHWGEGSRGVWKLRVRDRLSGDTGTLKSATVRLHGVPSTPVDLLSHSTRVFAVEGDPVTLSAGAAGDPMIHFEWRVGSSIAAEVLTEDWTRPAIRLSDAGTYTVTAVNSVGAETSPAIPVHVVRVETAPVAVVVNKTLSLKASVGGPGQLAYRWQRGGVDLVEGVDGTGTHQAQLTVKNMTAAQEGLYECFVSDGMEEKTAGARLVSVIEPPVMAAQSLDPAIVSGLPSYQFTALHGATRFEAKGVPPGMTFDTRTGALAGRPSKPGSHLLRIRARNAAGVGAWQEFTVVVDPLPDGVVGTFRGLLEANEEINQSLGGAIELKIGATGSLTGKLWLPGATHAFRGRLNAVPGEATPEIAVSVKRSKKPALELLVQAESAQQRCVGTVALGVATASWRAGMDFWHKQLQPAVSRQGYHTTLMKHHGSPATGAGFAGVSVDPGGAVRVTGRTADTLAFTQSRKLSRTGEVPVFVLTDKKRASLCGWLSVNEGSAPDYADGTVAGMLDWRRLSGLVGTRFHPEGFALSLNVQGARHSQPPADTVLMGLPDPALVANAVNAKISFSGASVATAAMALGLTDLGFSLTTKHQAVFPQPNPARVKVAINARTGLVRGSFDLLDPNPAGGVKPLRRFVTFHGMARGDVAEGCFLLPDLPLPPQIQQDTLLQSGAFVVEEH